MPEEQNESNPLIAVLIQMDKDMEALGDAPFSPETELGLPDEVFIEYVRTTVLDLIKHTQGQIDMDDLGYLVTVATVVGSRLERSKK